MKLHQELVRIGMAIALASSLTLSPGLARTAYAQTTQGQVAGTVTDTTGASIPNASIQIANTKTGSVYNTRSNSGGAFTLPAVALGTYTLKASAPGFKELTENGLIVQVGSTTPANLKLEVGGVAETVTVDASALSVDSETSDIGGVISQKQIEQLPLVLGGLGQLRAIESFVFLVPGTTGPGTATANQGSGAAQAAGIYLSKLGGGQNFGAEVLLDGISTYREENGSTFDETSPSVEAISEFKVTTSTPPAQYGHTSGGIEDFATRSGTNVYHGGVYDLFRNTALDANSWFSNLQLALCPQTLYGGTLATCQSDFKRAVDQKNDYGGTLGGPIRIPHLYDGKDKLLFFFSWEQFLKHQATTVTSSVPTALERTGNFTQLLAANGTPTGQLNPCTGTQNLTGEIFDPNTDYVNAAGHRCRQPFMFGGVLNVIDPAEITPLGKNILNAYPAPQTAGLQNNYSFRAPQTLTNTTYTVRIDYNLTAKAKLFGTLNGRDNTVPYGGTAPDFPGPAGANLLQNFLSHTARVGVDYVFTPNLINSFIIGYNRLKNDDLSSEITNGVNYATQLGIANIDSTAYPNIVPQGLNNGSYSVSALGAALNSDALESQGEVNDFVSYQKGRSSFKFGFDFRYHQFISQQENNSNGQIYGYTLETAAGPSGQGYGNLTGYGLASLALGLPDYVRLINPQDPKWITKYFAGYVQDDVKATPHLTLNLGLRYEVDTPRTEARNQTSNFSPTAVDPVSGLPGALVFGTTCNCNTAWANTYFKDIGPRLGFAYSPGNSNGKTVIRGGAAIIYAPILYADFGGDGADMLMGYVTSYQQGGDGFDPVLNLNNGAPLLPAVNLNPGQDSGNGANISQVEDIEPSFGRNGMVTEYSLQVQQELARDTVFKFGFSGNVGQNLPSFLLQPNNINPAYLALGDTLNSNVLSQAHLTAPYPGFAGTVGQALRPFPQYSNLTTPSAIENVGHSDYNALITSLDHRSRFGLTFDIAYTWSKTITDADSAIGGINGGTPGLIQNSYNLKTGKSISIQDVPNNLVLNYLYALPFGKGKTFGGDTHGFVNGLISGISLGGIQRYVSGVPFSFGCATGPASTVYNDCISLTHIAGAHVRSGLNRHTVHPGAYLLATEAPDPTTGSNPCPNNPNQPNPAVDSIFNGELSSANGACYSSLQTHPAFYNQNEDDAEFRNGGAYTFGNLPRVSSLARNFAYMQEDFVFIKDTPIHGDRYVFGFKTECLDCFNRHNFQAPDSNPGDATFGIPLAVVGGATDSMRRLQLTARFSF